MIDFIHVGDFKTGTTWMQRFAFRGHPEIRFLGDYFENREYHHLLHELVDSRDLDFKADSLKDRFRRELMKEPSDDRKIGISREVLSQTNFITGENALRNALRIYAVFGPVKFIYVIREQFSMLLSIYSQYVKMGGTLNLRDFIFDPFQARGLLNRLQYHKNVAMYYDIFGRENVHVGIYEQFLTEPRMFLEGIYRFIGCGKSFFPDNDRKRINNRLTAGGIFVQRVLNRFVRNPYNPSGNIFPLDKLGGLFLSRRFKQRADLNTRWNVIPHYGPFDVGHRINFLINLALTRRIEKLSSKIQFGPDISLPEIAVAAMKTSIRKSNRRLLENYSIPVDRYGWQV